MHRRTQNSPKITAYFGVRQATRAQEIVPEKTGVKSEKTVLTNRNVFGIIAKPSDEICGK